MKINTNEQQQTTENDGIFMRPNCSQPHDFSYFIIFNIVMAATDKA